MYVSECKSVCMYVSVHVYVSDCNCVCVCLQELEGHLLVISGEHPEAEREEVRLYASLPVVMFPSEHSKSLLSLQE